MAHLSEHDLWTNGRNHVGSMAPGPSDLFVVTTLDGKRVMVQPITDYERAVRVAEAFARRIVHDRPVSIKVLPMSYAELLAYMGTTRAEFAEGRSSADDAADRKLCIDTCWKAVRECDDPAVRKDAHDLLVTLGAIKQ